MTCKPLQSWESFADELLMRILILRAGGDALSMRAADRLERGLNDLRAVLCTPTMGIDTSRQSGPTPSSKEGEK